MLNAKLALSDGTILEGKGFGTEKSITGEAVFTTSLVGYEESITDPSYKGQILTFTYPLIGNYGVREKDFESENVQITAMITREYNDFNHHRNSVKSLDKFLKEFDIPAISGIDTRMLVRKLRNHGVMNSALITSKDEISDEEVLKLVNKSQDYSEINFLKEVSVEKPVFHDAKGEKTIVLIDTGVKLSIIREFLKRKINVWQMPYNTKPDEVTDLKPNGIFLANGPGDPERATDAIKLVRELQEEYPITGICF